MWIVTKDGKGYCCTSVPYDAETVKSMKKAGYKVKEVNDPQPLPRKSKGGKTA